MIAEGIIDPAKVTRSALQNAASIAALFLTTEAVVADKPEKAAAAWAATRPAAWAAWTSEPPLQPRQHQQGPGLRTGAALRVPTRRCRRRWPTRRCDGVGVDRRVTSRAIA